MALDTQVRSFLERLATASGGPTPLTVAERRASLERLLSLGGQPERVARIEKRRIRGPGGLLRVWVYTPAGAPLGLLPGLVYFHGGGFVAGSLETHDGICRSLANASGCRLVAVDYRLGPEAPFPAAVQDACAATRWVAEHAAQIGIDARHICVAGDAAGGTLAAVVAQTLAAEEEPPLALQYLLCPILDHQAKTSSRDDFGSGYLLERETLEHDLRHYLDETVDAADPRISPLRAQRLEGLPPACIHTAECDPLRDEGAAYAERLERAGVRVSYRCHPGMIHLFYGLRAVIPYAATAFHLMGADIRALFQSPVV
ncbi:MAG TPA: alpha/beta hydrolase [Steroidobacteraceae bacterium]|nr:alpha/beta hydrolase [Steroidobacteraceae bacterium]